MSNFTFLKTDWPELYETAREAEQNVASTPGSTTLTLHQPPESSDILYYITQ
jgi:hypothetical protein